MENKGTIDELKKLIKFHEAEIEKCKAVIRDIKSKVKKAKPDRNYSVSHNRAEHIKKKDIEYLYDSMKRDPKMYETSELCLIMNSNIDKDPESKEYNTSDFNGQIGSMIAKDPRFVVINRDSYPKKVYLLAEWKKR